MIVLTRVITSWRPLNPRLDLSLLEKTFGIEFPDSQSQFTLTLEGYLT